jgi:hypothetical protein
VSAVVDVGDALELTFLTAPGAAVTVSWFKDGEPPVEDTVQVDELPAGSGKFPHTFVAPSRGVWTAEFRSSGTATAVERYYVRATEVAGPAPLAAIGDVAAQYGSMTPAEESLTGWLLRAASNMVRARRPAIDQQIADGLVSADMAALAVTNMVLRVLRNPAGLKSETVGPFSRSYDTTVAAGLLVFSADEEAMTTPSAQADSGTIGQFTPRASLAIAPINRKGGWPDGWW